MSTTDEVFVNAKTGVKISMKELMIAQSSIVDAVQLYKKWSNCTIAKARKRILRSHIFSLNNNEEADINALVNFFRDESRCEYVLSKEEILKIFGDALDHAESLYFQDPLDVIITTAENIKKQGGLQAIAEKIDKVISKI